MIIKYPGGKHYHAKKIVNAMRATEIYCEPFFGSGKVFFWKMFQTPSRKNLLSDLDQELINFWKILKEHPQELTKGLAAITYDLRAFIAWRDHAKIDDHQIMMAMQYFVLRNMSRSGLMKDFSDSTRQRRGMDEGQSAWNSKVASIAVGAQMLQWASLDCCPALGMLELVKDKPNVLTYLDPTYILGTRVTQSMYKHEMTDADHIALLESVVRVKGKVLVSGYDNPLYRAALTGKSPQGEWVLDKINTVNRMSQTKELGLRTECLWRNYW